MNKIRREGILRIAGILPARHGSRPTPILTEPAAPYIPQAVMPNMDARPRYGCTHGRKWREWAYLLRDYQLEECKACRSERLTRLMLSGERVCPRCQGGREHAWEKPCKECNGRLTVAFGTPHVSRFLSMSSQGASYSQAWTLEDLSSKQVQAYIDPVPMYVRGPLAQFLIGNVWLWVLLAVLVALGIGLWLAWPWIVAAFLFFKHVGWFGTLVVFSMAWTLVIAAWANLE
jgi:hypothetical protein